MSVRLRLEMDGATVHLWDAPFADYTWDTMPDGSVRASVTVKEAPGDPEFKRVREACLELLDCPAPAPAARFELVQKIVEAARAMSARGRW